MGTGAPAKSDYVIEVIGVDKAGAVFASVQQAMDGVTDSTAKATKSAGDHQSIASQINKSYLGMRAIVSDVFGVIRSGVDHLKAGARDIALARQIDAIAGAAEKVDALSRGLMGTIENTELQRHVLLLERINLTAKQAADVGLFALAEAQRKGADTGQVLAQTVQALSTGRLQSFKALGINAKDTADAIRQMAIIGGDAMSSLEKNVGVGVDRIAASWDDMVSDMQSGFATFVYGVANGFDELVSALSQGTSDTIPRLKELNKLSEEIVSLRSTIASDEWLIPSQQLPGEKARLAAMEAREKVLRELLRKEYRAGVSGFAPSGGGLPLGVETDANAAAAAGLVGVILGRALKEAKSGGGAGGGSAPNPYTYTTRGEMGPGREIFDMIQAAAGRTAEGNAGGGNAPVDLRNAGPMLDQSTQAMLDFAETMREVQDEVGGAFEGIGDAFGGMIDALTDSGAISKTGAAARALARVQLVALAAQAGVKAVYEFAEGLGAAARYEYWSAAQHFAASVQYGVVAGTNIAKAVGGNPTGARSSGGGNDRPGPASDYLSGREAQQSGPTVIVITNGPMADYSEATLSALDTAAKRGARINMDVLPAEIKRQLGRYSQAA